MRNVFIAATVLLTATSASARQNFKYGRIVDMMTDEDRSYIVTQANEGVGRLGWKCNGPRNGLNVMFAFDTKLNETYLHDDFNGQIRIEHRFPPDKATSALWNMVPLSTKDFRPQPGTANAAALPISQVRSFTKRALGEQWIVVRAHDRFGETVTGKFSLDGLADGLRKLSCASDF
jgi:hypothetical protein